MPYELEIYADGSVNITYITKSKKEPIGLALLPQIYGIEDFGIGSRVFSRCKDIDQAKRIILKHKEYVIENILSSTVVKKIEIE